MLTIVGNLQKSRLPYKFTSKHFLDPSKVVNARFGGVVYQNISAVNRDSSYVRHWFCAPHESYWIRINKFTRDHFK